MNRTITKATTGIALLGVLAATALQSAPAQAADCPKPHGVNERQTNQQKRIFGGIHNDSLTNREAAKLTKREVGIARTEARYRASGDNFTKRERFNIERRQNHVSRDIYHQKHDAQVR